MRLSGFIVAGSVVGAAHAASNCGDAGNNCQRALAKTALPSRNPLADCNSYFRVTVTPATSTITRTTLTTTTVATTTVQAPIQKPRDLLEVRQATVSASGIPAYASPCSGAAKYSSACSCIGATRTTITVATPLTTTSTSTTVLATATATQTPPAEPEVYGYQPSGANSLDLRYRCNKFGFYSFPTILDLKLALVGGDLFSETGFAQNSPLGTWRAVASSEGDVYVSYTANPGWIITEVHWDMGCADTIDTARVCNPSQYVYSQSGLNTGAALNLGPVRYPTCNTGSEQDYLIVNAKLARVISVTEQ